MCMKMYMYMYVYIYIYDPQNTICNYVKMSDSMGNSPADHGNLFGTSTPSYSRDMPIL